LFYGLQRLFEAKKSEVKAIAEDDVELIAILLLDLT
jgi:hypothetical protein